MTRRPPADAVRRLAVTMRQVLHVANRDPMAQIRLLPPQDAFLRESRSVKMFRAGNQNLGKTTAGLMEVVHRCRGSHPYQKTRRPPIKVWVVCASWSQSLAVQEKLWHLAPKGELKPGQGFNPKTGFGGHVRMLVFSNGSTITFKTTKQDALDFSSATIDVVLFDEPPRTERIFEEAKKRVLKRGGVVLLCMTPINARIDWIRTAAEQGRIADLHYRLEPHHLIPLGRRSPIRDAHGVPCDKAWIDALRGDTPKHEEPVVIDGEWETRQVGRYFDTFHRVMHVAEAVPGHVMTIALGIDHGSRPGRQAAVLMLIDEHPGDYPDVYVIDELPEHADATTAEQDAAELLAMLRRHGWTWSNIDHVHGDRPAGTAGTPGRKGNYEIEDGLVRALRAAGADMRDRSQLRPRILSAKQGEGAGRGAPDLGQRWMYSQFIRGRLHIHPRCTRLIDALERWDSDPASPLKDPIDAWRYGLHRWIMRGSGRRQPQVGLTVR